MLNNHEDQLGGLSPANFYFNFRNKKTQGKCIVCGNKTKFNENTERYDRICSDKCRKDYREEFRKRMIRRHGKDTLLNDPEVQKQMLERRRISGTYTWSNRKGKTNYVGSYEKDFLRFLDMSGYSAKDIVSPSPIIIDYKYNGEDLFYIPDFYITDLDLLVEIKGTNNHYQKREQLKEDYKDEHALKSNHNYIKIVNKKYDEFIEVVEQIKNKMNANGKVLD